MDRTQALSILAACLATCLAVAASATVAAQTYVDTGKEFRQEDRVTMGGELLTEDERRGFEERRKAAGNNRQELDRIEAEESALLNQRVNERIGSALNPANVTTPGTR